jgi:hypothetical protein
MRKTGSPIHCAEITDLFLTFLSWSRLLLPIYFTLEWSALGFVLGMSLSIAIHYRLPAIHGMGFGGFPLISSTDQFSAVPKGLVIGADIVLSADGLKYIEKNLSEQSLSKLRDIANTAGHITVYDFYNARKLDTQFFNRRNSDNSDQLALKRFKNNSQK